MRKFLKYNFHCPNKILVFNRVFPLGFFCFVLLLAKNRFFFFFFFAVDLNYSFIFFFLLAIRLDSIFCLSCLDKFCFGYFWITTYKPRTVLRRNFHTLLLRLIQNKWNMQYYDSVRDDKTINIQPNNISRIKCAFLCFILLSLFSFFFFLTFYD